MKSFLAILLFAFIAGLHADDFDEFLLMDDAEGELPDRHPYVQCKIDLYDCFKAGTGKLECLKKYKSCMSVLIPTVPPFVTACNAILKQCLKEASWLSGKGKCFVEYGKCLANKGPVSAAVMDTTNDGEPDRHPYVQCKIDLYDCLRAGNKGKLECMKDYKNCMAVLIPTIPPFLIACSSEFKQCVKESQGYANKSRCFSSYYKCLKNKGPAAIASDVMEDMGQVEDINGFAQCQKNFYQCFRDGNDKKTCASEYKACMEALIPAYVKQCYATAKECFKSASKIKDRFMCAKQLGICLKNGASS